MTRQLEPTKFTSLQLELLRLYAMNPAENELLEIKDMLAKYFMRKAIYLNLHQLCRVFLQFLQFD